MRKMPSNYKDLTGKIFGHLTVIGRSKDPGLKRVTWDCQCVCGNPSRVSTSNLTLGRQVSCGCWNAEKRKKRNEARRVSDAKKKEVSCKSKIKYNKSPKGKAAQLRYVNANRDAIYRRVADWGKANPEVGRAAVRNRRARLRKAPGEHTTKDVLFIGEEQGWLCACCSIAIRTGYHVDHVVPVSRGGNNSPNNIQLLCQCCNLSKSDKFLREFLAEREPKLFALHPSEVGHLFVEAAPFNSGAGLQGEAAARHRT